MRPYRLHPTLTPARRLWLETLEQGPTTELTTNRAAADCLSLGWSDWWIQVKATGRLMSETEHLKTNGGDPFDVVAIGQCLTDRGQAVLEQARKREDNP